MRCVVSVNLPQEKWPRTRTNQLEFDEPCSNENEDLLFVLAWSNFILNIPGLGDFGECVCYGVCSLNDAQDKHPNRFCLRFVHSGRGTGKFPSDESSTNSLVNCQLSQLLASVFWFLTLLPPVHPVYEYCTFCQICPAKEDAPIDL